LSLRDNLYSVKAGLHLSAGVNSVAHKQQQIRGELGADKAVNDSREAVAYHEAGHAVVSMKLGYKCLYVTIIPDGDRLGHVCCEDPMIVGHDNKVQDALKVLIAARLSEGKHVGSSAWGDADDRVKATNLALLATDRDTEHAEALINTMIGEAWSGIGQTSKRWQSGCSSKGGSTFRRPMPGFGRLRLLMTNRGCASRKRALWPWLQGRIVITSRAPPRRPHLGTVTRLACPNLDEKECLELAQEQTSTSVARLCRRMTQSGPYALCRLPGRYSRVLVGDGLGTTKLKAMGWELQS
jgi:Peptidase family M41